MRTKLNILNSCMNGSAEMVNEYRVFLGSLQSYYITGLEALRHNGFGWYFEPKIIEVINTKIEGKISIAHKTVKFFRVNSIKNSKYTLDKKTGLKYADNEQIIKDIKIIKNTYAENVWRQMISRYGDLFIKNRVKFKLYIQKPEIINYAKYGV